MADLANRDVPVPSKIVIMGTSNVSLNERFSKLTEAKPLAQKVVVKPSIASLQRARSPAVQRKPIRTKTVIYEDEDDLELEDEYEEVIEEYIPRSSSSRTRMQRVRPSNVKRGRLTYRNTPIVSNVPIEQRISFSKPRVTYVSTPNQFRGRGVFKTHRGPSSRGGSYQNTRVQNQTGFVHRGGSASKSFRGARGRGSGSRGNKHQNIPKKSQDDLDRELDSYMKKSRHPTITVQDMES